MKRILGYREHQVLAYARATVARDGVAPSYEMIRHEIGIATRGEVSRIVSKLEQRGHLKRWGTGKVRRIRLEPSC